ncbi:MAG: hypothetical protein WCB71_08420 [Aestuariivirga sp.]
MSPTRWLSPSHKFILAAVVILFSGEVSGLPASAQGLEFWNKDCQKAYKKWKTLASHKAFAVSNSSAGGEIGQSCGYSWSAPSKSAAENSAVKSCESEKRYRSGKCYVMKSE